MIIIQSAYPLKGFVLSQPDNASENDPSSTPTHISVSRETTSCSDVVKSDR